MTAIESGPGAETPKSLDSVERIAAALRSHNIDAVVVEAAEEAREAVLAMIPDGGEVHSGTSKTLEDVRL